MRALPDRDLNLRDAADFVLDSPLGRKALAYDSAAGLAVFLRDLVASIHRLELSCQLAEFTDHGLVHLCSLADRISRWTCAPSGGAEDRLVDLLTPEEAVCLLGAVLLHDMGMLSQRPEDLPPTQATWEAKGQSDVASWIRGTHVTRLDGLTRRVMRGTEHGALLDTGVLEVALAVAKAHALWPWEAGFADLGGRAPGLAAVLAVSDLLDEDASRCDTATMLSHRQGTMLNLGHWIRHSLTDGRLLVDGGRTQVRMLRPPGTDRQLLPVFQALRNHFRLVELYTDHLGLLGAGMLDVTFEPATSCPVAEALGLEWWYLIPGLQTQAALCLHVMLSFMSMALQDPARVSAADLDRTRGLGMEKIDLKSFHDLLGRVEKRSPWEATFYALIG